MSTTAFAGAESGAPSERESLEPIALVPPQDPASLHEEFERVWGNPRGLRALTIVNHSVVATRFIFTGIVFFLIAGVLAMLMRAQLARPQHAFMGAEAYNQAFTAHGTMMMFLFAVPILQGVAAYLLPKMLGARDLVFPRLSAFGYFCYLFGGLIFTSSLGFGLAPDAGWFMYTPLSSNVYTPGINSDFWLLGITFVEISTLSAAVEIAVAILRTRAPGMALHRMPVFAWAMLVTSLMIIFGFPPLILASILLELERAAGWAFFDPNRGGDAILWQHLFWLFGHPEVYIIFIPAAGIVSTLLPVYAQRSLVGYAWVVVALIATGFISFGLWVHHMFTVGIPVLAQGFFSAASMLVAVPTGIQVFAWLATLWTGKPRWSPPMLWLAGFLAIFVAGGLTGVMLAFVPFNWQVHDTHFVVAHFHYVLVGGMLFPLVAGLYHWLPLASGRMPSSRLSQLGFWLTFIGFNGTFLVMHWTGLLGMRRRIYTYESGLGFDWPNLVSSIFGFVMAFGIAAVLLDLALHWRFGRKAALNPHSADTLEWASGMPPRSYNFASLPSLATRHPLWEWPELPYSIAAGRHGLPQAAHGRRETFGTDPASGRAREVIHLPGNTWLPLIAALLLAVLCIALLLQGYGFALLAALAAALVLLRWSWVNGAHPKAAAGEAHDLPAGLQLHSRTFDGPGLWGMGFTLAADASLYGSLVFAWLFLWTVAPNWQAPSSSSLAPWVLPVATAAFAVGWWSLRGTRRILSPAATGASSGAAMDASSRSAATGASSSGAVRDESSSRVATGASSSGAATGATSSEAPTSESSSVAMTRESSSGAATGEGSRGAATRASGAATGESSSRDGTGESSRAATMRSSLGLGAPLALAAGTGLVGCVALAWSLFTAPLQPRLSAHDAILVFLLWYLLLHGALAAVLAAMQWLRVRAGYVGRHAPYEPDVVALWWSFVAATAAVAWLAFSWAPAMFGAAR